MRDATCNDLSINYLPDRYFNPRIPCGMRLAALVNVFRIFKVFQSTHPMRDATRGI